MGLVSPTEGCLSQNGMMKCLSDYLKQVSPFFIGGARACLHSKITKTKLTQKIAHDIHTIGQLLDSTSLGDWAHHRPRKNHPPGIVNTTSHLRLLFYANNPQGVGFGYPAPPSLGRVCVQS